MGLELNKDNNDIIRYTDVYDLLVVIYVHDVRKVDLDICVSSIVDKGLNYVIIFDSPVYSDMYDYDEYDTTIVTDEFKGKYVALEEAFNVIDYKYVMLLEGFDVLEEYVNPIYNADFFIEGSSPITTIDHELFATNPYNGLIGIIVDLRILMSVWITDTDIGYNDIIIFYRLLVRYVGMQSKIHKVVTPLNRFTGRKHYTNTHKRTNEYRNTTLKQMRLYYKTYLNDTYGNSVR